MDCEVGRMNQQLSYSLEVFEGPLDLLLFLFSKTRSVFMISQLQKFPDNIWNILKK